MNDQPHRPRNRKRQIAGVLLVWMIFYPLSYGPYQYALGRGWIPGWSHRIAYWHYYPAYAVVRSRHGPGPVKEYGNWVIDCFTSGDRERLDRLRDDQLGK